MESWEAPAQTTQKGDTVPNTASVGPSEQASISGEQLASLRVVKNIYLHMDSFAPSLTETSETGFSTLFGCPNHRNKNQDIQNLKVFVEKTISRTNSSCKKYNKKKTNLSLTVRIRMS